ncbi:MAG: hypothetical protein JNL28_03005 [Planctomycetes bacterium]|nr:hypothetical protein [Planctomycetota bacterium]
MRALTLATASVLCFAWADAPHFAPADKSSVEKTIRTEVKFEATGFSMTVDGNEVPQEAVGDVTLTFEEVTKIVVTDRYVKSKGGRPLELDRTYDELAQTSLQTSKMPGMADETSEDKIKESDLESKTVRFTWNEKNESYDKKFAGDDGDDKLLKDLEEDLDFRGLLPSADAKVGDTWAIDGAKFINLLSTGGKLHFHESGEPEEDRKNAEMGDQLDENTTGKGQVTFKEIREKDGLELAVITFEADLKSHARMEEQDMKIEAKITPEGELLWDMKAKRIHALDVTGKLDMILKGDQEISMGGDQKHALHIEFSLEGTLTLELTTKTP